MQCHHSQMTFNETVLQYHITIITTSIYGVYHAESDRIISVRLNSCMVEGSYAVAVNYEIT